MGGVVYAEVWWRWAGSRAALGALWARCERTAGAPALLAWPRRAAVTSLTHPRMFHYLHAAIDDFLFVQMLDAERLVLANKPATVDLMRLWIQCALTLDCIMPIGLSIIYMLVVFMSEILIHLLCVRTNITVDILLNLHYISQLLSMLLESLLRMILNQ